MTSTHLFLFCLILIGFGLSRCNQYRPNKPSQTDSTLIELSTRITLLETDNRRVKNELDSLKVRTDSLDSFAIKASTILEDRQFKRDRAVRRGLFWGGVAEQIGLVKGVKK